MRPEALDTLAAFGAAGLLCLIVLALVWRCASLDTKLMKAERAQQRAEDACEALRRQVMRGSAVLHFPRASKHSRADEDIEIALLAGQPHAFTDSVLPRARALYATLVESGQIRPLKNFGCGNEKV